MAPDAMNAGYAPHGIPKPSSATVWSQPPSALTYPAGRVEVWRVRLDESPIISTQASVLSPDEVARANGFYFEKDRIHFTRCRSALRNLLSRYLAMPAPAIRFEYLINGKPQLMAEKNKRALQFNVSHSANMALIAVGSEFRLGVDVEKIRDLDTSGLAERFISPRERLGLQALPDHLRLSGFFACWTRKEAFLKATGEGLSFPLADFSVTTNPDSDPQLEEIDGNTEGGKRWLLADLSVADGHRATVAFERSNSRLEIYAWN